MYVLDTNTVIYFFKGKGDIARNLQQVAPQDIGIPSIVIYELQVGIAKSTAPQKRRSQLELLLDAVNILPFGKAEADVAAEIRADLERQGTLIGPYNTLIAATAIAQHATLVTRNTREFRRVNDLSLADWY